MQYVNTPQSVDALRKTNFEKNLQFLKETINFKEARKKFFRSQLWALSVSLSYCNERVHTGQPGVYYYNTDSQRTAASPTACPTACWRSLGTETLTKQANEQIRFFNIFWLTNLKTLPRCQLYSQHILSTF